MIKIIEICIIIEKWVKCMLDSYVKCVYFSAYSRGNAQNYVKYGKCICCYLCVCVCVCAVKKNRKLL